MSEFKPVNLSVVVGGPMSLPLSEAIVRTANDMRIELKVFGGSELTPEEAKRYEALKAMRAEEAKYCSECGKPWDEK